MNPSYKSKNYPSGKPLLRFVKDIQQYFMPDNSICYAGMKEGKFTRVEKTLDRRGYKQKLKTPHRTATPGVHEGPYQEFKDNELILDGWCKVDFNKGVEDIYQDKEATQLIKHVVLDKRDFSTQLETGYYEDGSVRYTQPYRHNIPHGDKIHYQSGTSDVRRIDEFDSGLLKKTVHFDPKCQEETTYYYQDPSARSFIRVKHRNENQVVTQFEKNIVVAKDFRDALGRCTQSHEYDENGFLKNGVIADYAGNSEFANNLQEFSVSSYNQQGIPTEAMCVSFDNNYQEIARYPIAVHNNYPVLKRKDAQNNF